MINVVLLAGGVGGAKLAEGLGALPDINLSVIGNIADDDEFHGLAVSPDIDTLIYSLSNSINRAQGWGVESDDFKALSILSKLGSETWMALGDFDFGLHIYRTNRLRAGVRPTLVVQEIAEAFGLSAKIILPTDNCVRTQIKTSAGWISFQEYFVKGKYKEKVLDINYVGVNEAVPTQEALEAISNAEIIIIAPSNPLLSITPILSVKGIKAHITNMDVPKIGVSPIIGGQAVKGPVAAVMKSMNMKADALGVSKYYHDLLSHVVIDNKDKHLVGEISALGLNVDFTNILMTSQYEKKKLARHIIDLCSSEINNLRVS